VHTWCTYAIRYSHHSLSAPNLLRNTPSRCGHRGDGPCAQFGRLDGSVCRLVGEMLYAITFRRVRIACTTWWVWCCRGTHTVFIPLVICSGPRHLDAGIVGMVHTHDLDASTAVCRLVGEMIYAITFSGVRSMHTSRGAHTVFTPLVICSGPRHLDAGIVGVVHAHDLDASTAVCRLVGEIL